MLLDAASSFANGKGGTGRGSTPWAERAAPADDTHTVTAPSVTTILQNLRTVDEYAAGTRTVTKLPRPGSAIRCAVVRICDCPCSTAARRREPVQPAFSMIVISSSRR